MKKKIIAIVLAVAMLAVAVIGGTLAYFTDTDEAENTFVVGNIDIELHEDNALPEGDNGYAKDDAYEAWLKTQTIVPDVEIEKDVWVDNVGNNDAYVRVFIQVPAFLTPVWADGYEQEWTIVETTENDDGSVTYEIWHNGPLAAKTVSSDLLTAVVMDKYTSYKDVTAGANLIVPINVEAIQARGFKSAEEAFAALDTQLLVDNGADIVTTSDELVAALEAGKSVVLEADVTTPADKNIVIANGSNVTLDLNGHTISGKATTSTTSYFIKVNNGGSLTIRNGNVSFYATTPDTQWGGQGQPAFPGYANNTISNSGKLVIENATITNLTAAGGASYAIDNYAGADLIVNNSVIDGIDKTAIRMFAGSATVPTNVTINSGKVIGSRAVWLQLPGSDSSVAPIANLTVNGGELISTNISNQPVIYSYSYGNSFANTTVTLNGGTYIGDVCFGGGYKGDKETVIIDKENCTFYGEVGRYLENNSWEDLVTDTVETVIASSNEELEEAAKNENATIVLEAGTYEFPSLKAGTTIIGTDGVVFEDTLSGTLDNTTIKNVEIKAGNAQRWAYSKGTLVFEDCTFHATSVYAIHYDGLNGANITYKNCEIIGWVAIGSGAEHITFEGCTIKGNGAYGVIRLYSPGTIKDCTFDVSAVNTTDVFQDGIHAVDCNIDVINCTNVNGAIEDIFNISGTGTITIK